MEENKKNSMEENKLNSMEESKFKPNNEPNYGTPKAVQQKKKS